MKKIRTWREYLEEGHFSGELQRTAGKYNKKLDLMFWTLIGVSVVGMIPVVGAFIALIGIPAAFWLRHYEFRVVTRMVSLMRIQLMLREWERGWKRDGMYQLPGGAWVRPEYENWIPDTYWDNAEDDLPIKPSI